MLGSRRLFRPVLPARHYPRHAPAPTGELLRRATELLEQHPSTTSAWHTHLDTVQALIKDLRRPDPSAESWKEWNAKVQLWGHLIDGLSQLDELGALAVRRADGAAHPRFKADDFTPVLLAGRGPGWFLRRAGKMGTAVPDPERVLRLMYDLGLRPTPFQLMLVVQLAPVGEILDRAERCKARTAGAPSGLDRAALQLLPLLRPAPGLVGLRRRAGAQHHEVELQKLRQCLSFKFIDAVAAGDTRFEPALRLCRERRTALLASLLDKVVGAELGADVRVDMAELHAANLHIVDALKLGTSPAFADSGGGEVSLADPIEVFRLLAAGTGLFLRQPAAGAEAGAAAAACSAPGPPRAADRGAARSAYASSRPAALSLRSLARQCARASDLAGTLRLCGAVSFPVHGAHVALHLAGAAHVPEDLQRLLPLLERIDVVPSASERGRMARRTPAVVWRLRGLALRLDAEAPPAAGAAAYADRLEALLAKWHVLSGTPTPGTQAETHTENAASPAPRTETAPRPDGGSASEHAPAALPAKPSTEPRAARPAPPRERPAPLYAATARRGSPAPARLPLHRLPLDGVLARVRAAPRRDNE